MKLSPRAKIIADRVIDWNNLWLVVFFGVPVFFEVKLGLFWTITKVLGLFLVGTSILAGVLFGWVILWHKFVTPFKSRWPWLRILSISGIIYIGIIGVTALFVSAMLWLSVQALVNWVHWPVHHMTNESLNWAIAASTFAGTVCNKRFIYKTVDAYNKSEQEDVAAYHAKRAMYELADLELAGRLIADARKREEQ